LPNSLVDIDPVSGQPVDIDATGKLKSVAMYTDDDWRNAIINIEDLESLTKYDFLKNLPSQIQKALKKRTIGEIKEELNIIKPGFLMADNDLRPVSPIWTDVQATVRQNTSIDEVVQFVNHLFGSSRTLQVGINQKGILEPGVISISEARAFGIDILHETTSEVSFIAPTLAQVSATHISIAQSSFTQGTISKEATEQVGIGQVGFFQENVFQIGSSQTNSSQISTNKLSPSTFIEITDYFNSVEVTFPSVIPSQQISSGNFRDSSFSLSATHNLGSSKSFQIQSTLSSYWNLSNSVNLTFDITDLPTGQLAEATITGYDSNGRPNSATISIDYDANGVGWFIDTTPGENSEFDKQLTDTAYQASTGTAAGKYDLLTTILHETGHTLGFINGYSEFDKNVKNGKFILTGPQGITEIQLTPDGSHLDSTLYPHDLLNTSLKPGIRKLPSQLDLAIINQLYSNTAGQNPTK
jgi:hypothetical protein